MKVLVTGGLGYIGSHTVVSLLSAGHTVVVLDNLDNTRVEVLNALESLTLHKIPFYAADIRSSEALQHLFLKEEVEAVIHFAAKKSVSEALINPLMYFDHNVKGLLNILEACEKFKVSKFVFSSSCAVYGEPKQLPVDEQSPTQIALSPYGNTKRIGEEIVQEYSMLNRSFKSILLRYFNPVGAHASGLIGELPSGIPSNLMPFVAQSAAGLLGPVKVFGYDYNTPDATAIRDYIHVMDLAEAHVKSLEYLNKMNAKVEVFNVGSGIGYSVLQLLNTFQQVNKLKLNIEFAPRRKGDIEMIWADASKIRELMSWRSQRDLLEMCSSAWKWQQYVVNQRIK